MWINDESTLGLPLEGLFNSAHGMCVLAANAKLEVMHNFLQMAEYMEEDLLFDDEFPDEECVPVAKKEKTTPRVVKKQKPRK